MRNYETEIRIGLSAAAIFGSLSGDFIKKSERDLTQPPIVRSAETLDIPSAYPLIEIRPKEPKTPTEEQPCDTCEPIDLNWVEQAHNEEITLLQERLNSLEKKESTVEVEAEKKAVQRSVEIYKIEKEEYQKMDENKDGKIDVQEFNKRRGIIYARTYPLKHQKVEDKLEGLLDEKWNPIILENNKQAEGKKRFGVIIEAGIYQPLLPYLIQYKLDLENEGKYEPQLVLCNDCSAKGIKDFLINSNSSGVLMVGDLPTAWFRNIFDTAFGLQEYVYPDDLYFMDLNGLWGGETSCLPWWKDAPVVCFTEHWGEVNPEIILGRLVSPVQDKEIELLANYFRKNHYYRTGNFVLPFRSLNYLQNSGESGLRSVQAINRVYPVMETVDLPITSKSDFILRWQKGYEHLWMNSHAGGTLQFFPDGVVTYEDVRNLKPKFNFYGLRGCAIANYTEENCIGLWYVFQDSDYGLLSTGSTKISCLYDYEKFYHSLAESKNFGEAFKEQFTGNAWDRWCFGGFTLLGDPTLKVFPRDVEFSIFIPLLLN